MLLNMQLTVEQIQDQKEIQDGLLIPIRLPLASKKACDCSHCKRLNCQAAYMLENENSKIRPDIIPQLGGKVSTKIQR